MDPRTTEVSALLIMSHQGHMLATQLIAEDVDLDPQAKRVLARFLPGKVTPPPHSCHNLPAGSKSLTTTHIQGEEGPEGSLAPPLARRSVYGNYLEFLTREICFFSPRSFVSVWTHGYLF